MSGKSLKKFISVVTACVTVTSAFVATVGTAHASADVLILGTTVLNGANSLEAQAAQAIGLSVEVVDDAGWSAKTAADFASYRAIILGDPDCGDNPSMVPQAAVQNTGTWGPAVKGNLAIIGTDPTYHSLRNTGVTKAGADKVINKSIAFAAGQQGRTGAYISLSCYYYQSTANTPVPLLDGLSQNGFTVRAAGSNDTHVVTPSPGFTGLTDTDVRDWDNSAHEGFDKYPSNYNVVAMVKNGLSYTGGTYTAPDGTIGTPYILTRGSGFSLTVDTPSAPASPRNVPITDLPLQPNSQSAKGSGGLSIIGSPIGSGGLSIIGSPIGSGGLSIIGSPAGGLSIIGSPLASGGLSIIGSPLGDTLGQITLGDLPLTIPGGWEENVLKGTVLADAVLTDITLQEVLKLNPPGLANITFRDLDLANSRLGQVSFAALVLGNVRARDITLPASGLTWCQRFESFGFANCGTSLGGLDATLMHLEFGGFPADTLPLAPLRLHDIDMTRSPLLSFRLGGATTPTSPTIDSSVGLSKTAFGSVHYNDLSPANQTAIFNCVMIVCGSNPSVADAAAQGAVRDGATVSNFGSTDSTTNRWSTTVPLLNDVTTLGEILYSLVTPAEIPYESMPLGPLALERYTTEGSVSLNYHLNYTYSGAGSIPAPVASVTLPTSFAYVPGSSSLSTNGGPTSAPGEPTINGSQLSWTLTSTTLTTGSSIVLNFKAGPGLTLGIFTSSARMSGTDLNESIGAEAPVTVTDGLESNNSPATATTLIPDRLTLSHISSAGDIDYFRYPVGGLAPGSKVDLYLSHLAYDADLVAYLPPGAPSSQDLGPKSSGGLSIIGSPIGAGGLSIIGSPLQDTGSAATASTPELLQDVPILTDRPVAGFSVNRGVNDEFVEVTVPTGLASTDSLTVQVSGYLGSSASVPYVLRAKNSTPSVQAPCNNVRPFPFAGQGTPGPANTAIPEGTKTIFLVNHKRLGNLYGPTEADKVIGGVTSALNPAFLGREDTATTTQGDIKGVVVSLDQAPASTADANLSAAYSALQDAYSAWDNSQCDVAKANVVVKSINAVVTALLPSTITTLQNVVMVGSDSVIPFARISDLTRIVPESSYAQSVAFTRGSPIRSNALTASFGYNQVQSDNPYGTFNSAAWLGQRLYVPQLATGRLGETPSEIAGQINRFAQYNGQLNPTVRGFTSGYDFMKDMATKINAVLGGDSLISDTWNASSLASALNTSAPSLIALNGHADHFRLLSAAGNATRDSSETLAASGLTASLPRSITFSMGCNAGLGIEDVLLTSALTADQTRRVLDFPQRMSQLQAGFVGNTGHGYGDVDSIAYSERIMLLYAQKIKAGFSAGSALRFAKQDYFGEQGAYDVYKDKALEESTLWGLPQWKLPASATTPITNTQPSVGALATDADTGLQSASFAVSPSFTQATTTHGTVLTVGSETPEVDLYRPITARTQVDGTKSGQDAGGVYFTGLASTDTSGFDPVIAAPLYDNSKFQNEPASDDVAFPADLGNISTQLTAQGSKQNVNLFATQFRASGITSGHTVGNLRKYTSLQGKVFYRSPSETDKVAPTFTKIDSTVTGTSPNFTANFDVTLSDETPGDTTDIKGVSILVRDSVWKFVKLTNVGGDRWTGSTAVSTSALRFFAQAVDNHANVARSHNKAVDFGDSTPPTITINNPPSGAIYTLNQVVKSDFSCSDAGAGLDTCQPDAPVVVSGDPIDTASPGKHVLRIRAADKAGNVAIKERVYYVKSTFLGFTAPVYGTDDPNGTINVVNSGRAIPFKWQMKDASGNSYAGLKASDLLVEWKAISCSSRSETLIDDPSLLTLTIGLQYDPVSQQYVLVVDTPKTGWQGLCRRFRLTLNGVDTHFADFKFK